MWISGFSRTIKKLTPRLFEIVLSLFTNKQANRMVAKNIMLITGPDLRHRYYINHLNYNFKLAGVLIEPTDYPQVSPQTAGERSAWDWFFSRRQSRELKAFSGSENLAPQNIIRLLYVYVSTHTYWRVHGAISNGSSYDLAMTLKCAHAFIDETAL